MTKSILPCIAVSRIIARQRPWAAMPVWSHLNGRIRRLMSSVVLAGCSAQLVAAEPQLVGNASAPAEPLSLWYRQPAAKWTEALPIGNGRIGAMVFGGINRERLQLNEDTLWAGGPYDPVNPKAKRRCRKCASWSSKANIARPDSSSAKKSCPSPSAKCPMKRRAI